MKQVKLYNMIFPIWLIWLIPLTWFVIIPGNFIIDSICILIFFSIVKVDDVTKVYKKVILKTWVLGFVADIIASIPFVVMAWTVESENPILVKLIDGINMNPTSNIYSFLYTLLCVIFAGVLIYIFNYKIAFRKLDIDKAKKRKAALLMAVFTAPYLYFLPAIH